MNHTSQQEYTPESRTTKGGTMTCEGFIPYCLKDGVEMPVALAIPMIRRADFVKNFLAPDKHPLTGEMLYVQPDGRRVTV